MRAFRYPVLFLMAACSGASLRSETLDPVQVRFSSVTVPPQSIRLDSTRGSLRHFSGELTYDLASDYDSVPVHVYFEEVPVQRTFMIHGEETGRAPFVRIDSLCTGDLGWVKPKPGCRVRWRYATSNPRNHCRLKVGMANLEYLVAWDSTASVGTGSRREFAYNSLGLPVRRVAGGTTAAYAYSRHGFPLFEPPYSWTRYDSLSRRTYFQYGQGPTLQAIFGYAYDSLSRLAEIRSLPPGYPMEAPGPPFNREKFRLDGRNRVVYREINLKAEGYACNPAFRFDGVEKSNTWYYEDAAGGKIDSTVVEYHDSTRAAPLLFRTTRVTRRDRDSLLVDELETSTGFDSSPGSCFAPAFDGQTRREYKLDNQGWPAKTEVSYKSASGTVFSAVDTLCAPREYDAAGRVVRSFLSCEDTVGSSWTFDSRGFVKAQSLGGVQQIFERRLYDLDTLEAFAPQ